MFRILVNGSPLMKMFTYEWDAHRTAEALQEIRPDASVKVVRV